MLSYLTRILAGSAVGYVFGLIAGGGLITWSLFANITHANTGAGVAGFLFVLSFQSAVMGAVAGLLSAKTRGWDILWRTIPAGAISGLLLVVFAMALLGWRTGPNHQYVLAARSARNVAAINILWGSVVGLVVGLCFQPFYKEGITQSLSPTSPDQDG